MLGWFLLGFVCLFVFQTDAQLCFKYLRSFFVNGHRKDKLTHCPFDNLYCRSVNKYYCNKLWFITIFMKLQLLPNARNISSDLYRTLCEVRRPQSLHKLLSNFQEWLKLIKFQN